ncbi:hypothetical protein MLD38_023716 [Melastoma candidum]|uniref:Uncharacterized protein n=1 Tax=Melastoma candidum TaxID=119954 RepID=A0ACB9NWQ2_9MYRT|nr:hypothetical protein MLD38_023716 [Melastoma candidum]
MGSDSSNRTGDPLSRMAMGDWHNEDSPYFDGWKVYWSDPFHPAQNPHRVIQMGLAENQLCADLIEEWLVDHPNASIFTAIGSEKFKGIANLQDHCGMPEGPDFISIASALRQEEMSSFGLVSSQTQHVIVPNASDDGFMERFLAESSARLAERQGDFTRELE